MTKAPRGGIFRLIPPAALRNHPRTAGDCHPGFGALAQLGERYNGIVEVRGSIPLGSTKPTF